MDSINQFVRMPKVEVHKRGLDLAGSIKADLLEIISCDQTMWTSDLSGQVSYPIQARVITDFLSWTGGVHPGLTDDVLRLRYLETRLPADINRQIVEPWLRGHWRDNFEQLRRHVREGKVPGFSDLHDYMDANTLGDSERVWAEIEDLFSDEQGEERAETACAVLNAAQDEVDRWIKAGGMRI